MHKIAAKGNAKLQINTCAMVTHDCNLSGWNHRLVVIQTRLPHRFSLSIGGPWLGKTYGSDMPEYAWTRELGFRRFQVKVCHALYLVLSLERLLYLCDVIEALWFTARTAGTYSCA